MCLKAANQPGQGKTDDEVDDCSKEIHLHQTTIALSNFRRRTQKIRDRQHIDQRSVLKEDDCKVLGK